MESLLNILIGVLMLLFVLHYIFQSWLKRELEEDSVWRQFRSSEVRGTWRDSLIFTRFVFLKGKSLDERYRVMLSVFKLTVCLYLFMFGCTILLFFYSSH